MRPEWTPMAMVTNPGIITFVEKRIPPLSANEVLIKVAACAICGSDRHLFHGRHPFVSLPTALGHEISGTIVQVGEQVRSFKEGDPVVVEPVITCGRCGPCQGGRYHLCENISFHYRNGQGGFTRYFVAEARWVHPVPPGVDLELAALAESLAVALHAIHKANLKAGDPVCVFGDGPLGLLLAVVLRETLTRQIFLVGHRDNRLEMGRRLGFRGIFNGLKVSPREIQADVLKETQGEGVAATFEATGKMVAFQNALALLRKGGTMVLLGLPETPTTPMDVGLVIRRELVVRGSQGYCWDFPGALKLLKAAPDAFRPLITHSFPLKELQKALELLSKRKEKTVKILIHPE